jgi:hypothetical protein
MTIEKKRVESLEEMVFKTRNKSYGAYVLRKKYQKYTLISLIDWCLYDRCCCCLPDHFSLPIYKAR